MVHMCIIRQYAIDLSDKKSVINGRSIFENTDLSMLLNCYVDGPLIPD